MKKQNCRSGCCFLGAAALHSDVCLFRRLGLEPATSTSADFLTWIFSSKTTSITESHNQGKHQHNKHKDSLTQTHTQYSYSFGSLIADFVAWISLEAIMEGSRKNSVKVGVLLPPLSVNFFRNFFDKTPSVKGGTVAPLGEFFRDWGS